MATRRRDANREVPFPNQWRAIRITRQLTQRDVARALGHLNVNYYKLIERGLRFPGPHILLTLLALFRVDLRQAYPRLAADAEERVRIVLNRRRRPRSNGVSSPPRV